MMPIPRVTVIACLLSLVLEGSAQAGMPSVALTDLARMRVQSISFFLACFLTCSWVVQRLWNSLKGDFPRLPRLSFARSNGLVALWGLLFLLVLTMISGARELMTPGAWKKEGLTYTLSGARPTATAPDMPREAERRASLERLRIALWTYARSHDGRFPPDAHAPEVPEEVWLVPDASGMRYIYRGGLAADRGATPLAFEPGLFGERRFMLRTDGQIVGMTSGGRDGGSAGGGR